MCRKADLCGDPPRRPRTSTKEKTMGRPINKRKIGQGSGRIMCTRYFFTGASEVNGATTPAWIVSQRSTRKFKVTDGSTTEILTLVNQSAGDLIAGQFAIDATLDDSTVVQVTKLHNRTIQYEGGREVTDDSVSAAKIKYNIGPADDDGVSGTATVDDQ